MRDWLSWSFND